MRTCVSTKTKMMKRQRPLPLCSKTTLGWSLASCSKTMFTSRHCDRTIRLHTAHVVMWHNACRFSTASSSYDEPHQSVPAFQPLHHAHILSVCVFFSGASPLCSSWTCWIGRWQQFVCCPTPFPFLCLLPSSSCCPPFTSSSLLLVSLSFLVSGAARFLRHLHRGVTAWRDGQENQTKRAMCLEHHGLLDPNLVIHLIPRWSPTKQQQCYTSDMF